MKNLLLHQTSPVRDSKGGELPSGTPPTQHANLRGLDLATFRTKICEQHRSGSCHNSDQCPHSHCQTWQRRNPNEYAYSSRLCPEIEFVKKGKKMTLVRKCNRGRACAFAHSKEEELYHPSMYKTKMCNAHPYCVRYFCPFAHSPTEVRKVASTVEPNLERTTIAITEIEEPPKRNCCPGSPMSLSTTASTVNNNSHWSPKKTRSWTSTSNSAYEHCWEPQGTHGSLGLQGNTVTTAPREISVDRHGRHPTATVTACFSSLSRSLQPSPTHEGTLPSAQGALRSMGRQSHPVGTQLRFCEGFLPSVDESEFLPFERVGPTFGNNIPAFPYYNSRKVPDDVQVDSHTDPLGGWFSKRSVSTKWDTGFCPQKFVCIESNPFSSFDTTVHSQAQSSNEVIPTDLLPPNLADSTWQGNFQSATAGWSYRDDALQSRQGVDSPRSRTAWPIGLDCQYPAKLCMPDVLDATSTFSTTSICDQTDSSDEDAHQIRPNRGSVLPHPRVVCSAADDMVWKCGLRHGLMSREITNSQLAAPCYRYALHEAPRSGSHQRFSNQRSVDYWPDPGSPFAIIDALLANESHSILGSNPASQSSNNVWDVSAAGVATDAFK